MSIITQMSKQPRCAQTGRFVHAALVQTVGPTWPALLEDVQEVLASHVFDGPMQLEWSTVGFGTAPSSTKLAQMSVSSHHARASRVCSAWNRAFKAWVPRGIAVASARAWAIAIRDGLGLCQSTAYVQNAELPLETSTKWDLFLHEKSMATLTLTRSRKEADNPDEHKLRVCYQAYRAPRRQLDTMHNERSLSAMERIIIPPSFWTDQSEWHHDDPREAWQREKAAFLETWVLQKHETITSAFRVNLKNRYRYYA